MSKSGVGGVPIVVGGVGVCVVVAHDLANASKKTSDVIGAYL